MVRFAGSVSCPRYRRKMSGNAENGTCTGRNRIRPAGRYRENSAYDAGQDEQVIRGDTLPGGRPVMVYAGGKEYEMYRSGEKNLSQEEVEKIFHSLVRHSAYSYQEDLRNGFVTLDGGHRGIWWKSGYRRSRKHRGDPRYLLCQHTERPGDHRCVGWYFFLISSMPEDGCWIHSSSHRPNAERRRF